MRGINYRASMTTEMRNPDTGRVKIVDECIKPDPSKPQTHQQPSPQSGKKKESRTVCGTTSCRRRFRACSRVRASSRVCTSSCEVGQLGKPDRGRVRAKYRVHIFLVVHGMEMGIKKSSFERRKRERKEQRTRNVSPITQGGAFPLVMFKTVLK